MLNLLFAFRSHSFRRYFGTQRIAKAITIVIFLGVLGAVGFGIFEFFRWELSLIVHDAYLRVALPLYLYEGLFLIVFILVFLSSFITGLFALFRGDKDALVMASPHFLLVFWKTYWRTLVSSLWPIIVMTIPAFLGASVVFPATIFGTILFVIAVSLLAALAVSSAFVLFLLVAIVLGIISQFIKKNILTFGRVALWSLIAVVLGLGYTWVRVAGNGDVVRLFAPTAVSETSSRIDIIVNRFHIFPSHLTTLTLLGSQNGSYATPLIAVLGAALFLLVALAALRGILPLYLPLWQALQEGKFEAKSASPSIMAGSRSAGPIRFPRYTRGPLGALFEKEGLILFRQMKSLFWFLFLFILWMIQVGLEFFIRTNLVKYQVDLATIVARVESLELVTVVYFMSAFILRFVFPAFSGERKTAWILGTAPVGMRKLFWAKFLFYGSVFLALTAIFCGVNFTIIQTPIAQTLSFIVFVFLIVAFLVAYGLGLGAIFPSFETDDPELLSTSLPGLAFIFGSLLYGGWGVYLFYRFLSGASIAPVLMFDVLTAVLTFGMLAWALRSLETFEFVKEG